MISIRLREAMAAHAARTGERLTYEELARRTGLSRDTLQSISTRPTYNATLGTVEKLCRALHCSPGELLVVVDRDEAADDAD